MSQERERWSNRGAFIMAAVGSAIGLGNVWRFPFLAFKYGGGSFFVPYFIALVTAGIPLMILEYALGQKTQKAAPGALAWIHPKFEFVGWWAILIGLTISIYYAVVMSWSLFYLFSSFHVSWSGHEAEYFNDFFLHLSGKPEQFGNLFDQWKIILGLFITWFLVYLIIHKGVGRVGKVVMWTVPLPAILLFILLIRGLTLPGALDGILAYLTPNYELLKTPGPWLDAYGQIFFSLSLGFGILIAYASYRPKDAEITNSANITSFANCAVSFFAGFAVFTVLGFLAAFHGQNIKEVAVGGPGLAFKVYPEAIAMMPGGIVVQGMIGFLFFFTLLTLGIDSLFSIVEAIAAALHEKLRLSRENVCIILCVFSFLSGLIFCTRSGLLWLDIVDHYMTNYGLVGIGLLECIAIGFFYETGKMRDFINEVSEVNVGYWWEFFIRYVIPVSLVSLIGWSIIHEPYGNYEYWALFCGGWGLLAILLMSALFLARSWTALAAIMIGSILFLLANSILPPSASLIFTIACLVLFGGLFISLWTAWENEKKKN